MSICKSAVDEMLDPVDRLDGAGLHVAGARVASRHGRSVASRRLGTGSELFAPCKLPIKPRPLEPIESVLDLETRA